MTPDLFNGLFEFTGGLLLWGQARAAYKDKAVRGVRPFPTAFFAAWGLWNLYYYPSLDQWWSFWGGVNIVLANITWTYLLYYYRRKA